jgi:hypothetical protein
MLVLKIIGLWCAMSTIAVMFLADFGTFVKDESPKWKGNDEE